MRTITAPDRLPFLLEIDLNSSKACGWAKAREGDQRPDLPHGHREPYVGSAAHSWVNFSCLAAMSRSELFVVG
jgi:hypothetical protein